MGDLAHSRQRDEKRRGSKRDHLRARAIGPRRGSSTGDRGSRLTSSYVNGDETANRVSTESGLQGCREHSVVMLTEATGLDYAACGVSFLACGKLLDRAALGSETVDAGLVYSCMEARGVQGRSAIASNFVLPRLGFDEGRL